jgi:hypothetical protein
VRLSTTRLSWPISSFQALSTILLRSGGFPARPFHPFVCAKTERFFRYSGVLCPQGEHSECIPLIATNPFSQQAIVKSISQVRFANGKCPTIVRQFLIDQLKYNDNTANSVGLRYLYFEFIYSLLSAHGRVLYLHGNIRSSLRKCLYSPPGARRAIPYRGQE